ncbi:MAG: gluconate 5-dehydrogenase [Sulfobacillus acidophilus]|uniref:Gluconate 5-dehydrogenase n=1 Tax=Sulfobacillus acidophilus TaxID=53633 RepID=A0A2T2WLW0_9FIRM|nr:MAG: gluconate 5-dehydrogenase [Sulfobacillus acidophilus]
MRVQELFDLTGQVAIVTGGGRGLGEAMARALAEAGAAVVMASRKRESVEETAAVFRAEGFEARAAELDVTNIDDIDALVQFTMDAFGRIDVLVNNSGTSWGAPALDLSVSAWEKVLAVNVTGTFLMSQRVARVMQQAGGGSIINIASVAGLSGLDARALDAVGYSTSKGAIIAMTRDLAHKWAPYNIRVNAIAPGWFPTKMSRAVLEANGDLLTEMIPLKRFGTMDDIKGVALLLASRASDYMTGTVLVVDGGSLA